MQDFTLKSTFFSLIQCTSKVVQNMKAQVKKETDTVK